MELKKSLEPGVMMHTFNPSIQKAEAGRSLSLRPAWSTEQVQGQSSLGSEGKQKAGEDVIKEEGHILIPASGRIWHLQPRDSGVMVKDRRKEF